MGRVVIAPDKFKGSLTAAEVAEQVRRGLHDVDAGLDVVKVPVADGGDGTLAAALAAGFDAVPVTATGPTGRPVTTAYARRAEVAVVELADVSGLSRLPGGRFEPLTATSRGTGEVIAAALSAGCTRVILGIGGSACTDGGAGMARALGARLPARDGREVADGGAALLDVELVDLAGLHPGLATARVHVACDVDNPLTGPDGAAAVYGPQKGAGPSDVRLLDAALGRWADVVAQAIGVDRRDDAGAGAAGGVGFGAIAVLGATLEPGIDLVLDLVGFHEAVAGAQLVITGEGSLDEQSLRGKAPLGVAAAAGRLGVPVVAVCGRSELTSAQLRDAGISAAYSLRDLEPDLTRSMAQAAPLLQRLGRSIARDQLATKEAHGG